MTRLTYLPGDSFFHRMDPTVKLAWNFLAAALVASHLDPLYGALWFGYAFGLAVCLARLPLRRYLRLVAVFAAFGLSLGLWQAVYNPGGSPALWAWGPVHVTLKGLSTGVAILFRVLALTSLAAVFTLTTEPARLMESLIQVARLPYRLAYTVYAGLRFMPLFQDEAQIISNAHQVRGVSDADTGLFARLRLNASLVVPLLVSGIRRARAAAIAMDSRAFGAYDRRTVLHPQRLRRRDLAFLLGHVVLAAALFYYFVILGQGRLFIG